MRSLLISSLASAAALSAQAEAFRTAAIFGDHMVLPAAASAPVHGFGPPGATVSLRPSWGDAVETRVGADGRWELTVKTGARGARGRMQLVCGAARSVVEDILFGDVWLASGQSNMEWPLKKCDDAASDAAAADLPDLRVFTTARATGDLPADDVRGAWVVCTPERAPEFTAVGFYFARELLAQGVGPIGLVDSSWGGTVCQAWTSAEGLTAFPEFAEQLTRQQRGVTAGETEEQRERFFEALRELPLRPERQPVTLPVRWSQSGLRSFDGAVDYVRKITLPAAWLGQELMLTLGAIDDMDTVFWNGRRVAGSERDGVWSTPRRYVVPADHNTGSDVELRVCVVDTGGEGGFTGTAEQMTLGLEGDAGSAMSLAGTWMRGRRAALSSLPEWPRSAGGPNRPAVLWNGMIQPLLPFSFAGAIWYQGESNRSNPDQYARLFPAMIRDWRRAIGRELPFYFVQIAPYGYGGDGDNLTARLRDAQAAALQLPRTGMAVTLDVGDAGDIHPTDKLPVGLRLARHALSQHYGSDMDRDGPIARDARRDGAVLRVTFEEEGRLVLTNGSAGFFIAGAEGAFHPAKASVAGDAVLLRSDAVPAPVRVRYAWSAAPDWTLCDQHGLPAPPFALEAK